MRAAIGYSAFAPDTGGDNPPPRYPMDAPTRATANHFGDKALIGIKTSGSLAATVPINRPYAGQGAEVLAFPLVQPSRVSPDAARVVLMSAQNFYSPSRHPDPEHRLAASAYIPPPATKPTKDITMPPKYGMRGTGGHYTHPFPMATVGWPTSSDWLAGRTVR